MYFLYLFGAGESAKKVLHSLKEENVRVLGFIDNNPKKQGTTSYGFPVVSLESATQRQFHYIIIATLHFEMVIPELLAYGMKEEQIISFYNWNEIENKNPICEWIFHSDWKTYALKAIYDNRIQKIELKLQNLPYELERIPEKQSYPIIRSHQELLKALQKDNKSLVRFGDGEFEIMLGRNRAGFQEKSEALGARLKEILRSKEESVLVAIANNYGSLESFTEEAADSIRNYLTPKVRKEHMELLEFGRVYYDAYLSRPYIPYKDKKQAKERFDALKKIWENREVVLIEGDATKAGIGNDLFCQAASIERIICPRENAYHVLKKIFDYTVKTIKKSKLILVFLGPAATVLAYDLALEGYQAIDLGHIDLEYEWFLRGCEKREKIPGKYVNEIPGGTHVLEYENSLYDKQIIKKILH